MRVFQRLRWLLLACAVAVPATSFADTPTVCIKPLGKHDRGMMRSARRGIEYLYGMKVRLLEAGSLPDNAYYPKRRRYRAEKLLAHLERHVVPKSGCDYVLGFTAVDISTTKGKHKDWGILGLALIGGPVGVVSSYRVRKRASRRIQHQRVVKVVNHELGHALGSDHIPERGCLMEDYGGTVKSVDQESGLLCPRTRTLFERKHGITLPNPNRFDWRRVVRR